MRDASRRAKPATNVPADAHRRPATARVWLPGDGKANPTDLTQSLAKGARNARRAHLRAGARSPASTSSDGARHRRRRPTRGRDRLRKRRQLRRPMGARRSARCAASPCRCIRPSTSTSSPAASTACTRTCRCMRDPDGYIYYKEEVGGLRDGRLRAATPSRGAWTAFPTVRVPAPARGLGPVRDPDEERAASARRAWRPRRSRCF